MVGGARIERRVFLSHSSEDKPDIQKLARALEDRGIGIWEDVLELRLGDSLEARKAAILGADGFVLLLTPAAIGSEPVQQEVAWAEEAKVARPDYKLLPLLRGLARPALKVLFREAPLVSFVLGDEEPIESAVTAIAQALGLAPQDATPRAGPTPLPLLAELVIDFDETRIAEESGTRRAAAKVRVRYEPADGGRGITKGKAIAFEAPLGANEAKELRWYLQAYGLWPFGVFKDQANALEASLPVWGRKLFDAVLGRPEGRAAFEAWRDAGRVDRRITVLVDERDGDSEAAAMILALPWELLADEQGYLFEGNLRARVRRMLPSEHALPAIEPSSPLRVLLVLARPEDESASFLDPRASAIPLAEALDPLGNDVTLTVLADGSFKALRDELDAGERAGQPYQVVHFDGHGVYDAQRGLGQLCFENADDAAQGKLERRTERIDAGELGALLRDRRVALFVLEACQTAMTSENATASVAARLLMAGVASVVAMSHAVYVETGRRFVKAFYGALAAGDRIGAAMVRAQHALKDDRARGEVGPGELVLSDWMVPVLFQEHADARLFPLGVDERSASVDARKDRAKVRLGDLPEPPAHGFVGRAKALLAIDRRLRDTRCLALVGGGGQGKTALAVEAARWLLAMRRVDRVAFVSVEEIGEARVVLDAIGRQLVAGGYSVAMEEGIGSEDEKRARALLPVKRELARRKVLLVVDNLESVLPKPGEVIEAWAAELLGMIRELSEVGGTRMILTSREAPPALIGGEVLVLPALGAREGLELLKRVLRVKGLEPLKAEEDKAAVERLVGEVGGHARSLVLLGALVAEKGVQAVADDVHGMMEELEARYPDQRERSLIASVNLSLRRLPEGTRGKIIGLAVFRGAAPVESVAEVLRIEHEAALDLCNELQAVGLTGEPNVLFVPDPGLGTALAARITPEERDAAEQRWLEAMMRLVAFLYEERYRDTRIAANVTRLTLTNLIAALPVLRRELAASRVPLGSAVDYVTRLDALVSSIGLPRMQAVTTRARRALGDTLSGWSHERFNIESEEVDRSSEAGDWPGALKMTLALRDAAETASDAYPDAGHDRAMSWFRIGRVLGAMGRAEESLGVLGEAQARFTMLESSGHKMAARMVQASLSARGNALRALGRLEEASIALEGCVVRADASDSLHDAAVYRGLLGSIRLDQGRLDEALVYTEEAKEAFKSIAEPGNLANIECQIGRIHARAARYHDAEDAFRRALQISSAQSDDATEASALHELGHLFERQERLEDAVGAYRQAAQRRHQLGNALGEAQSRGNLGQVLRRLGRLDEARDQLVSALALHGPGGHAAEPWKLWRGLEELELDAGNGNAAREARSRALDSYRAYRSNGGEPAGDGARAVVYFGQYLIENGAEALIEALINLPGIPDQFMPTLQALRVIAAGGRDVALLEDPGHHPMNAVELEILLGSLLQAETTPPPTVSSNDLCPCGSGAPFHLCHGTADPSAA